MRFELRPYGFLWTGKGDGCVVAFSAEHDGFHGVISCLNANYGIDPNGSSQLLTRYDAVPGATPVAWEPSPPQYAPQQTTPASPTIPTQVDTGIDILVVYTEAVRNHFDPAGGSINTQAFMKRCVDVTQTALNASTPEGQPVIEQVNLVAAKKVYTLTENDDDFRTDLDLMAQPSGEVAKLRKFWAADVVILLTEDTGNTYGLSNIPKASGNPPPGPDFAPYASAVVMRSRAIEDATGMGIPEPYVFMHEFAHTIGADHNRENAVNLNNPVEDWSFGYWHPNNDAGGERTILSYYLSACIAPCPRVLFYSNSQVSDDWFHTGVAGYAENARTILDYGPVEAQYQLSLGRIFYDGFEP
jgi:hypothetical protein